MGSKLGAAVSALSLAGVVGLAAHESRSENKREWDTCTFLGIGEDMSRIVSPKFLAQNSLDAALARCDQEFKIAPTEACAAQSIIKTIRSGVDLPRFLIDDARRIESKCD